MPSAFTDHIHTFECYSHHPPDFMQTTMKCKRMHVMLQLTCSKLSGLQKPPLLPRADNLFSSACEITMTSVTTRIVLELLGTAKGAVTANIPWQF